VIINSSPRSSFLRICHERDNSEMHLLIDEDVPWDLVAIEYSISCYLAPKPFTRMDGTENLGINQSRSKARRDARLHPRPSPTVSQ
jgi:hypothetical protein